MSAWFWCHRGHQGTSMGPGQNPRYTDACKGRPWVAQSTTSDNDREEDPNTCMVAEHVRWTLTAKVYVFSDFVLCQGKSHELEWFMPVLCLGGISTEPIDAWERKIKWFLETRYLTDLDRIEGEPIKSEWKISQDSLHWAFWKRFKHYGKYTVVNLSSSKEG